MYSDVYPNLSFTWSQLCDRD